jgi:hypothetical protein
MNSQNNSPFESLPDPHAVRDRISRNIRENRLLRKILRIAENGAVMLAAVFKSRAAVTISDQVVRVFEMIASNQQLRRKLLRIERKLQDHDQHFAAVFNAIRQLRDEEQKEGLKKSPIGYDTEVAKGGKGALRPFRR